MAMATPEIFPKPTVEAKQPKALQNRKPLVFSFEIIIATHYRRVANISLDCKEEQALQQ